MDRRAAQEQLKQLTQINESDPTLVAGLLRATQAERQIIARQREPLRLLGACIRSAAACIWKQGAKGISETAEMLRNVRVGERKALWRYVCRHDQGLRLIGQLEKSNDKLREQIGLVHCEKVLIALQQLIEAQRAAGGKIILFFAPYFYDNRLQDGYFQRVQAIDRMLSDEYLRIYVSWFEADPSFGIMQCKVIDDLHIELTRPYPQPNYDEAVLRLAKMVGLVYHHSITFALENITRSPDVFKIYDMHGAYPEEERLYGKCKQAALDEEQERLAMLHGQVAICVTQQMVSHLQQKYPDMQAEPLLLPIYTEQGNTAVRTGQPDVTSKPRCVYAGGMQKWQCVEEMQQLIRNAGDKLDFCIFTRQPEEFWRKWKGKRPSAGLTVAARTPEELRGEYLTCQYGMMLREDCVINRVACPTKLIEYLEYGIIPVMSTTAIGDFVQEGMQYVTVDDIVSERIPSEDSRQAMAAQNRQVLRKMKEHEQKGKAKLIDRIHAVSK